MGSHSVQKHPLPPRCIILLTAMRSALLKYTLKYSAVPLSHPLTLSSLQPSDPRCGTCLYRPLMKYIIKISHSPTCYIPPPDLLTESCSELLRAAQSCSELHGEIRPPRHGYRLFWGCWPKEYLNMLLMQCWILLKHGKWTKTCIENLIHYHISYHSVRFRRTLLCEEKIQ